jgi:hypothetical protein
MEIKYSSSAFKYGITEEEYDALDELLTKTTPKVGANGTGFVSKRNAKLFGLDELL